MEGAQGQVCVLESACQELVGGGLEHGEPEAGRQEQSVQAQSSLRSPGVSAATATSAESVAMMSGVSVP